MKADTFREALNDLQVEIEALKAQLAKDINVPTNDTISRQAAIDALGEWLSRAKHPCNKSRYNSGEIDAYETAISEIENLPSVQPNPPENGSITCISAENMHDRTSGDLISRQAAIEINRSYHGQMPNEVNHRIWKEIKALPSAQPEIIYCKDCKHYRADIFGSELKLPSMYDHIIVAHHGCKRWSQDENDMKCVKPDGYCFLAERREDEVDS